jgi:hypothetical protein
MKYFTRGFVNAELDDDEVTAVRRAYAERLEIISPQLTEPLQLLAKLSLHDAIIESTTWEPAIKCLNMSLVAPCSNGYQGVRIKYNGALLGHQRIRALRSAARDRDTQILASEVDVDYGDEGIFSHRLLFWPREELTINFSDVEVELTGREDERVFLIGYFREIHHDESLESD